jgi:hopanoid biosynthesis associated radical SAM protein HpnH
MIYPEIGALVRGILRRHKHIYLCTNGMFIKKKLHEFRPTSRFFFNVHLDGLEETHDIAVEREGVFRAAVDGIVAAKKAGFLVCTNTTIYKETDLGEIDRLYAYLSRLGVDGFLLSPAYGYQAVHATNPQGAAEIFLTRDQIRAKFREATELLSKYRLMSSPVYLEFLAGKRELSCTAWGNPTRNVKGWKGPCYLITDEHHATFRVDGKTQ